ncbi:MAG: cysteine desulfurase [Gemmatimonadales bacterium]|nr:cysteine desulfurase [Gemmatimonadales bacterium]
MDVERIRADFPILSETVRGGRRLVYLDNAATSQKPRQVIEAISRFYSGENANIHRGLHYLSERATAAYDAAREKVARFLGAGAPSEIVFTRGTTEAINLVAQSWGRSSLRPGDEVLATGMEHHANLVPWQVVCEQTGATFRAVPITDRGELDLEAFDRLLSDRTRLFAVGHVSNALGTVNPVRDLAARARARGALVLVDGAQSAPHMAVDVSELGCDFFACSGHKLFGPTGIGVLYGRQSILDAMPPWQTGGDMIERVTLERSTWAAPPARFEAGTPPIAEVMGLGAAIDYVESVGLDAIGQWESDLLSRATELVGALPGVRLVGTARAKAAMLSFVLDGVHPHDVGTVLDDEGIAVRAGHHCAQPVMQRFGLPATVRASFAFYNTPDEIEALVRGVERARKVFG